jgi:hypothetical protein
VTFALTALDYVDDPIAAVQDTDLLLHLTELARASKGSPPAQH